MPGRNGFLNEKDVLSVQLILPYFKKNLGKIILGILCMIIVDCTQLAIPHIIKQAVDILAESDFSHDILVHQVLFIVVLGLVMAVLRYFWRILLMGSARDLEKGIRQHLYSHILTLDQHYFNRVKTGDIMAHATSDINHIRMAFGMGIIALTDALLLGTASIAIMLWMNPKLTLAALLPMPLLSFMIRYLGRKMHAFHTSAQESYSELTELIREGFSGIRVLKLFNLEAAVGTKVARYSEHYFKKNLKRATVTAFFRPLMGFFFNLSTGIVLFYGGVLVMDHQISPGELVAFTQYLGILAWPIIAIGWMTNLIQRGLASLKRINALLDARPMVESPRQDSTTPGPDHSKPDTRKHFQRIIFDRVDFGYDPDKPLLSDITLDIPFGSVTGISGPPGSGKTTLVQLIPRIFDTTRGTLRLDDTAVTAMELDTLREMVAFMPQEPFLFSGTIRENILMGRSFSSDRLDHILSVCQLSETIRQMPDGLDTLIGEKGITLSGGQKQRITLARTLIQDKPVTILDDPISQVDTQTASAIIQSLQQHGSGRIMIIISHRMSALSFCDRILVLEEGRITHQGDHDALMTGSHFYRTSFTVQQFQETHGS